MRTAMMLLMSDDGGDCCFSMSLLSRFYWPRRFSTLVVVVAAVDGCFALGLTSSTSEAFDVVGFSLPLLLVSFFYSSSIVAEPILGLDSTL